MNPPSLSLFSRAVLPTPAFVSRPSVRFASHTPDNTLGNGDSFQKAILQNQLQGWSQQTLSAEQRVQLNYALAASVFAHEALSSQPKLKREQVRDLVQGRLQDLSVPADVIEIGIDMAQNEELTLKQLAEKLSQVSSQKPGP